MSGDLEQPGIASLPFTEHDVLQLARSAKFVAEQVANLANWRIVPSAMYNPEPTDYGLMEVGRTAEAGSPWKPGMPVRLEFQETGERETQVSYNVIGTVSDYGIRLCGYGARGYIKAMYLGRPERVIWKHIHAGPTYSTAARYLDNSFNRKSIWSHPPAYCCMCILAHAAGTGTGVPVIWNAGSGWRSVISAVTPITFTVAGAINNSQTQPHLGSNNYRIELGEVAEVYLAANNGTNFNGFLGFVLE